MTINGKVLLSYERGCCVCIQHFALYRKAFDIERLQRSLHTLVPVGVKIVLLLQSDKSPNHWSFVICPVRNLPGLTTNVIFARQALLFLSGHCSWCAASTAF